MGTARRPSQGIDYGSDDRLERELASPSRARLSEYAIARESGDLTLRRIGRIAERFHLGVAELAGGSVALPTVQ